MLVFTPLAEVNESWYNGDSFQSFGNLTPRNIAVKYTTTLDHDLFVCQIIY